MIFVMQSPDRRARYLLIILTVLLAHPCAFASSDSLTAEQQHVVLLGLIHSLQGDAASAQAAARALGGMGPAAEPAIPDLIQALQSDEEVVASAASDALVSIGSPSLEPLQMALGHANFRLRRRAAQVLARFGAKAKRAAPALVELLTDPQFEVHTAADQTLVQLGDDAIPALSAGLRDPQPGNRQVLLTTLARCGPKGVPVILNVLKKDDSNFVRANAAEALGQERTPGPEVVQGLIQALSDLEEGVRAAAANALGQLGPDAKPAIGPLIAMAQGDRDAFSRKRAADALGRIGPATRASLDGLAAALHDQNPATRKEVIDAVVSPEVPWADELPLLVAALKDPDAVVRLEVVCLSTAAANQGSGAIPLLRQALGDSSPDVRSAAILSLGQLKNATTEAATELGRPLLDPDPAIRQEVIQSLGNLGTAGLPGLLQALADSYSVISDQAGKAIVRLGKEAVPALQTLQNGSDPLMKKKAADLLRRIAKKSRRQRSS